jgi:hypothetical protein
MRVFQSGARAFWTVAIGSSLLGLSASVHADVTTQQTTTLDVAGIITMHGNLMERTSGDKQRSDTDFHCDGLMSIFCRKAKSSEIIRVDRGLNWELHPDSKSYLETHFPTAEERALAQQQLQATLEKMKQCRPPQAAQGGAGADTSDCDLSPPKVDVAQTDEHATLAGHDARKSSVKLTQTCTNRKTGDVCELVYGFDVWLTADEVAGTSERRAFEISHLKALGLDAENPATRGAMQSFLAQYAGTMKDLASKASSLRGYPLRTRFSVSMGGEHCGQAKQLSARSTGAPGSGTGTEDIQDAAKQDVARKVPDLGSSTANAIAGKVLGGLFARKSTPAPSATAAPPAAAAGGAPYATLLSMDVETSSIDTASIPASQFELPAGWLPEKPKTTAGKEFSCPAAQSSGGA